VAQSANTFHAVLSTTIHSLDTDTCKCKISTYQSDCN